MLQGDQDVAVTPDQAEMMRDAFARAGKTAILHMYTGEGHGWQRAATIRDFQIPASPIKRTTRPSP